MFDIILRIVFQYGALIGGSCIVGSHFGTAIGWATFLLVYSMVPPIRVK